MLDMRYLGPIEYPWAFGALHTALNVIQAKPEVHDNLFGPTILSLPTTICWSRSAFKALGNPSSALDLGGYLLDMVFTIGSMQDPSNVPLWHVTVRLQCRRHMKQIILLSTCPGCPCKFWRAVLDLVCTRGYEKLTLLGLGSCHHHWVGGPTSALYCQRSLCPPNAGFEL